MKHQEKKYHVKSFTEIEAKLKALGAKQINTTSSTHYYAKQTGNNVVKLVHYSDKDEIHILDESNGTFSLKETIPVKDTAAGFQWLKDKGYTTVDIVKMDYADYEYKNGIVGLYVINDFLRSVILDFPEQEHEAMEKLFGLNGSELITIPYNKYLKQLGQLEAIDLSTL